MRILQVTPYFAPAWAYGGPPRVMYDYATGLAERGHVVEVLTTDVLDEQSRATPAVEIMEGVRVRRLPNLSNSLAWRRKKYLPRGLVTRLAREMSSFDVVHVTDTRTFLTASAYLAARARRVPFCLSAHGSLPESSGVRGAVKRVYDRALVRPMLGSAAALLAQTSHEADLYVHLGASPDSVKMLPLPIDLADVDLTSRSGSFRSSLDVAPDARLILFLGRLNRLKGIDLLIEAVEPLLDDETVLAIVGRDDGEWSALSDRYKNLLADGRMRFAGALYGHDRFTAYRDADVFCLTPRHWEETSVASLEAAACGTAVVVSEQAEIPGLQESGGGYVVPLAEASIQAAVNAALADPQGHGARARALVARQHAVNVVVDRLEKLLLETAASSRERGGGDRGPRAHT